jgi:signal transduction histidine kinase
MQSLWRCCRVGMLLLPLAGSAAHAAEPQRVLLLHSFGPHFAPWSTISPRFREELRKRSSRPIDLYESSLEGERIGAPVKERPFIDYLHALFAERPLDLVVTLGAPATRFLLRNRAQLFPSTPLLVAATDARAVKGMALTDNDAVVPVDIDSNRHIDAILRVLPDTTDIVIAIGDSPLERFWVAELRRAFEKYSHVTFHWFDKLTADEMVQRAAALPARHVIYYATVRVDVAGAPQEGDRVLDRFFETARTPIFSYLDSHFGHGIVGGPLLSTREIAMRSAEAAVRILDGAPPGEVRLPAISDDHPMYDWRELQEWGISEDRLPPGSEVHFRAISVLERYRVHIAATAAVLILQTVLISWLAYEHRRRHRAEIQSRNAIAELTRMNRVATAGELSASIAHEVGQPITAILLQARAALRMTGAESPNLEKIRASLHEIAGAGKHAHQLILSVRGMFRKDAGAVKAPVDINDLIGTVLSIMQVDLQSSQVRLETRLDETLPAVEGDAVQLQQVILNLTMNAVEAMRAMTPRVLKIQSSVTSAMVNVSIADSGPGISEANRARVFDPLFTTKAGGIGMGLAICRSIVESHNGRICVSTAAGGGAIFQFELPAAGSAQRHEQLAA